MNITYYESWREWTPPKHQRADTYRWPPRFTLYIDGLPTRQEVDSARNNFLDGLNLMLMIGVGVAYLHPNDDFVKKNGRELAKEKLTVQQMLVTKMTYEKSKPSESSGVFGTNLMLVLENDLYKISILYPLGKGPRLRSFHDKIKDVKGNLRWP